MKTYYVYILGSLTSTLYTGMTNDIQRRMYEHKKKLLNGFTKKYFVDRLLYVEETNDVRAAILREKEIKGWRRSKKIALIKTINPNCIDLAENWFDDLISNNH
jgi:putative endonuclease